MVNAGLMACCGDSDETDPTGRNPTSLDRRTRAGVNLHRALGYVFVLAYVTLLFEMVPRAWEFGSPLHRCRARGPGCSSVSC